MSDRRAINMETIGDRMLELEREVRTLKGLVNASWKTSGYVLYNSGTGLYVRNTNTNVDTLIAP
jgi:hypothetical protein